MAKLPDAFRVTLADGTKVGELIPGSKYQRSICRACRQPIRVKKATLIDWCDDCARSRSSQDAVFGERLQAVRDYHGGNMRDDT